MPAAWFLFAPPPILFLDADPPEVSQWSLFLANPECLWRCRRRHGKVVYIINISKSDNKGKRKEATKNWKDRIRWPNILVFFFIFKFFFFWSTTDLQCVYHKVIQLYMYTHPFSLRFFSHIDYHRILGRVLYFTADPCWPIILNTSIPNPHLLVSFCHHKFFKVYESISVLQIYSFIFLF